MAQPITLSSPLPAADLRFESLAYSAGLSTLEELRLELISPKSDLEPDQLLGQQVDVAIELRDGGKRCLNGYVTRFGLGRHRGRYFGYQATVRPWLWLLTRTSDCRIFQNQTVDEIVATVFADHTAIAKYEFNLYRQYRKRPYCVQYRETDFNFVARLLEDEGIFWYFDHAQGEHKLILVDDVAACTAAPGCEALPYYANVGQAPPDHEYISSWNFSRGIEPGKAVLTSYDFERPSAKLLVEKAITSRYALSDQEQFDFQGDYTQKSDGEQLADTRIDEQQARHEQLSGITNAHGMAVGHLFGLDGHPRTDQNAEYLCLQALITAQTNAQESGHHEGELRCSFSALSSSQAFRPPRQTRRPSMQGPQTAMVVGPPGEEIFTDKYGRVKVQFHWDRYGKKNEMSSCWMRVSQPWAGKGWGGVSIPRIGQEVVVDFLEGDPDQPIVTGRVYNAESMQPYTLPEGAVVSGIKSQTHKGKGYNELAMDDTAGKEKVTIHAQYDMNTTVEHDQTNTVHNTFTETIKSHAKITVTEGTYSHDVAANTATYHVKGALTENYDATQDTTAKSNINIKSTGGAIAILSDSQHVYINAATSIQLNVGASNIWMDSGGQIRIKGVNVAIEGSANVTIKGGTVHSEADSEHQTKGAIVLSEGSATNTVKGGMVMLNP